MELTFLAAANDSPLVKTFAGGETKSYPNIAKFNSYVTTVDEDQEGMRLLTGILQMAAAKGHCLLKGPLKEPLVDERRKGKTDKEAPTRLLVLDIDGVKLDQVSIPSQLDSNSLKLLGATILSKLPEYFHNASYVLQASASLGRKPDSLSLHMYFFLDDAVHPRVLKDYLTMLNLDGGFFEDQLSLTATGVGMRYGVDRSLADNSRLIYLGTPKFLGEEENPFTNDEDRIVFVEKPNATLDACVITDTSSSALTSLHLKKLNKLRVAKGMGRKNKIKYDYVLEDGERIPVLSDPDQARLMMAEDEGDFVRYNMNGGDSNAYWVFKYNPEIVHNFKGEPAFRFKDVDFDGYQQHVSRFRPEGDQEEADWGLQPFAFLDWYSAPHWGLVQSDTDEIVKLNPCKRESIKDLYAQYDMSAPETLPVIDYRFCPQDERQFDREGRFINKYRMPKITAKPVEIPEKYHGATMGYFADAKELFPTVFKLLYSVCGCGEDDVGVKEMEYFINWLAFVVQERKKALTAWVFHGTQGTGKGLLFDQVIAPILGTDYAVMKRTQDLDDFFNGFIEQTLLIAVDEFRTDGKGVKTDLTNKLKNMITEDKGTLRAMRTDQQSVELFTNFIFFSNDKDAVRIPGDDRRFNVAPRQETGILARFPNILEEIEKNIVSERERLAAYLLSYQVDEKFVSTPMVNEAKENMRDASATSIDLFVEAMHEGNLDYFLTIMDEQPRMHGECHVAAAQNIIKATLRNFKPGAESLVWLTEVRPLYNVLIGRCDNVVKLGKILRHHNLDTVKIRKGQQTRAGFKVTWNLKDHDIEYLRETYLTTLERALPDNDPHAPVTEYVEH